MRPSDRDLQQLGPFPAGANNLSRETSVPRRSLREAVNVDLSDDGKVRRRKGYELIEPFEAPSALVAYGRRGFVLADGTLYAFEVEDQVVSTPLPIYSGLRPDARLAHAVIEPDLFLSDGDQNLRVAPDNQITPWSIPTPGEPLVVAAGGPMDAGRYMFAVTGRLPAGEEGPPSATVLVEAQDAAQFFLTLPPALPDVPRFAIYMTKVNGSELLFVGSVPSNAGTVTVASPKLGRPMVTDHAQPMPPGEFAMYFRGRLWVATDALLTASEPFQYSVTQTDFNTIPFSETITGLGTAGEAGGAFFVGQQSKVYLARGDSPGDLSLTEKYPFGMVPGTLAMVPGARLPLDAPPSEPVPAWLATNGVVCIGLPDGSVLPLTEANYAADVGATGAGMFLQRNGESRYIATTANPRENVFAVRDEVAFEVVRNGIPVPV